VSILEVLGWLKDMALQNREREREGGKAVVLHCLVLLKVTTTKTKSCSENFKIFNAFVFSDA